MKLSRDLSDKELRDEIYKLRRDLREDFKDIRKAIKSDKSIPNYALKDFRKAEKSMREKAVKYMSRKDLVSTYRNLTYIRNLKSSNIEGIEVVKKNLETAKSRMKDLANNDKILSDYLAKEDKTTQDKFWDIYKRVFDGRGDLKELYKYEIWETIADYMESGNINEEKFSLAVSDLYDKLVSEKESETQDISFEEYSENEDRMEYLTKDYENARIQFTEELRKLFSNN